MNADLAKLLVTRLATAVGTLLFVATAVFVITTLLPGDVAQQLLGQAATPEAVAGLRHALGLDRPPLERFLSWLAGLLTGNPGVSLVNGLPVATLIGGRLGNSLLLAVIVPRHPSSPNEMVPRMIGVFAVLLVLYVLLLLASALYAPAAIYAALQAGSGVKVTCRQAYAVALRKAGRYIGLMLLLVLIVVGPVVVVIALIGGAVALTLLAMKTQSTPGALIVLFPLLPLLYVAVLVYNVLAMIWLSLAYPACVAEDLPPWAAIRRSIWLTKGGRGRIFLLLLLIYGLTYLAMMAVELVVAALGGAGVIIGILLHIQLLPWGAIAIGIGVLILFAAIFLLMATISAVYAVALTVLYRDQRLRKEGVAAAAAQTIANPAA